MPLKLIYLLGLSIPVFYYDLKFRRIPNWLSFGSWLGFALILVLQEKTIPGEYFMMSIAALGSYLLVYFASKGRFGMGDVKLSLIMGGINGLLGWYFTNLIASVSAIIVFLILLFLKKVNFKTRIPFGPFLCTGGIAHQILSGNGIL